MVHFGRKQIEKSGNEVYIIAEIGQNHQGSIDIAKQMIQEAKKSGCDCVKFQKSCLPAKFTHSALNRIYNGPHSWGTTYGEHKQYLEFSEQQYRELQNFCRNVQIDFTASAMDEVSLQFLETLNVPFIKIGSGDANNFPLLKKAAKLARPLIISTGMQSMKTVDRIVDIMQNNGKNNYALMHCVSAYPTDPTDSSLHTIVLLQKRFPNIIVGYSGHEWGLEITQAAVFLGAKIVERHFTLNKEQKGSDHKCSLVPAEFKQLVDTIALHKHNGLLKNAPLARNEVLHLLGNKTELKLALKDVTKKIILPSELICRQKLGKSIVTTRELTAGHLLQPIDLCIKVSHPNGISAEQYELILGAVLLRNIKADEPITSCDINKKN